VYGQVVGLVTRDVSKRPAPSSPHRIDQQRLQGDLIGCVHGDLDGELLDAQWRAEEQLGNLVGQVVWLWPSFSTVSDFAVAQLLPFAGCDPAAFEPSA
jgi:hypothetical protein